MALEFSSCERSVAILAEGGLCVTAMETGGRDVHALELIRRALAEARLEREQIECLAVGLGPGSYTGIRASIAVAQGWQLALPVKLLGIASVECLAMQAQERGWFGAVNIAIDAQRNEFYLARYEIGPDKRQEIAPLKLASFEEVAVLLKAGEIVVGPDAEKLFAGARTLCPGATTVALLATGRADFVAGEKLEPVYLRETTFVKAPAPRILPGS
ncbi:MAG TPA: tRNA (adenosine(37)-N6)-threonylcarbamoyltransferase complex dimerization subunit type 1 TsaB [Verrucomicrobiae bacterium]|nr:tRNA (adenosine(37)-N6)-threonylcarbamoyltransferase complex dimerization subunit type 1 TsaB [Verrucomicrobiae bacterium]